MVQRIISYIYILIKGHNHDRKNGLEETCRKYSGSA